MERLTQCNTHTKNPVVAAHCNIPGNEEADKFAKQGGALQQEDLGTTYKVAKQL
jgi:hypothetical protein